MTPTRVREPFAHELEYVLAEALVRIEDLVGALDSLSDRVAEIELALAEAGAAA